MVVPWVSQKTKLLLGFGMAFSAGYCDVICLVRFHCFASMMTGNLIEIGRSAVDPAFNPILIACIIFCFQFGVCVHTFIEKHYTYGSTFIAPILVLIIALVETFPLVSGYQLFDSKWVACLMAPIFGVQSSVSMMGTMKCPTTMCTGHLQGLAGFIVSAVRQEKLNQAAQQKRALTIAIICGVPIGAVVGALLNFHTQGHVLNNVLMSPMVAVLACLIMADDFMAHPPSGHPAAKQFAKHKFFSQGTMHEISEILLNPVDDVQE